MRAHNAIRGPWAGPGGPRVLVENPDFAIGDSIQSLLIERGYDVAVCEGPNREARRRCPLVTTGECALAAEADVIVQSLNLDRPEHAEVLRMLQTRYPAAQIVIEIPQPRVARHAELLAGCSVLGFPATRESLTNAVRSAVDATLSR